MYNEKWGNIDNWFDEEETVESINEEHANDENISMLKDYISSHARIEECELNTNTKTLQEVCFNVKLNSLENKNDVKKHFYALGGGLLSLRNPMKRTFFLSFKTKKIKELTW